LLVECSATQPQVRNFGVGVVEEGRLVTNGTNSQ
jgi:hypothetical protein